LKTQAAKHLTAILLATSILLALTTSTATWPSWQCQGTPTETPDWHDNDNSTHYPHGWGRADVKGDQDSADFCCVCHREAYNPDPGVYWGYADCVYYGPLWYEYAYTHVRFYWQDSSGTSHLDGETRVYIYCD